MGYHRPESLESALSLLKQTSGRVAAGCTDLFPATDARELHGPVVDVTAIPSLRGIEQRPSGLRIGATTTWTEIIEANLPDACKMLKEAAREVGSVQIQNAGTIAGNLCNASPAADAVPCLLALDADVEIASIAGKRVLPLDEFLTGPRKTALKPGEIVSAIHIPESALEGSSRFRKLGARRFLVISIVMVAVRLHVVDRYVVDARVAVGSCSAVATRLAEVEQALSGRKVDHTLADVILDIDVSRALSPVSDIRADASYRNAAAQELIRRALTDLFTQEAFS